jgi:hypothetical protein
LLLPYRPVQSTLRRIRKLKGNTNRKGKITVSVNTVVRAYTVLYGFIYRAFYNRKCVRFTAHFSLSLTPGSPVAPHAVRVVYIHTYRNKHTVIKSGE